MGGSVIIIRLSPRKNQAMFLSFLIVIASITWFVFLMMIIFIEDLLKVLQ
jgi:energy-coupling factor transporter transmembrane protein EcfT